MKVLVFEDNLMWSSRLTRTLKAYQHEPILRTQLPVESEGAEVAIINLGSAWPDPRTLVDALHGLGIPVIAHAGHKELELMDLGREAGADILATNRELTFKLPELVNRAALGPKS